MTPKEFTLIGAVALGLPILSEISGFSKNYIAKDLLRTRAAHMVESLNQGVPNLYEKHYQAHKPVYRTSARTGFNLGLLIGGLSLSSLGVLVNRRPEELN